ncbi:hypothetical protein [Neobacillus sp. LXY-4]|uniref:hypothetical protein n=1 Tax=Neobacillus sp. LXY-4 TaxID=3379826 RepID=UPI003EDEB52D
MANITIKKMNLFFPLLFFVINLIFSAFLIEELFDASDPNYGITGFFTPITGLISFIYLKKFAEKKLNVLLRVLQLFNGVFIIFPIVVFIYGIIIMIG